VTTPRRSPATNPYTTSADVTVTGPPEQAVRLGGVRWPLYARVQLAVHPRLLPALTRALAEVAATTEVDAVPTHQCPHTHQPVCPHGHDHATARQVQ
ncbi:MAG: hypothetical protein ACQEXM_28680, partial [Actinomycetota bacterium]